MTYVYMYVLYILENLAPAYNYAYNIAYPCTVILTRTHLQGSWWAPAAAREPWSELAWSWSAAALCRSAARLRSPGPCTTSSLRWPSRVASSPRNTPSRSCRIGFIACDGTGCILYSARLIAASIGWWCTEGSRSQLLAAGSCISKGDKNGASLWPYRDALHHRPAAARGCFSAIPSCLLVL